MPTERNLRRLDPLLLQLLKIRQATVLLAKHEYLRTRKHQEYLLQPSRIRQLHHRSEDPSDIPGTDSSGQFIQEMRGLVPPEGCGIANIDGGPLYDCRLPGPSLRFGPFSNIQDFHNHLRQGISMDPNLDPEIQELIIQHQSSWPLKFTHGDLSSLNILACGDKIVGIIDWETAGWYPSYWEYTTACYVNPQNYFWRDEIDKFLDPMPKELAMEETRRRYFGDF
ncbi:hypothetical protein CNMCM7691_003843 [Aspergillus felis]|uniref:Aminoglycoside phosphotransferase domain-containing protein n=1 Tax=Aspergillus felis TaxID=1287682 RepID=A0A8H6R1R4_9EURO|nr:hypothetical protein CNMCM7691_003843 [Aspergillus felis]